MKQKNFMKMMAVMLTMSMLGTTPVMAGEGEEKVTLTIEMSQDMKAQNNDCLLYTSFLKISLSVKSLSTPSTTTGFPSCLRAR